MKSAVKIFITILLFNAIFSGDVQGQIAISNTGDIAKVKNGTTYIAMKDPLSEKSKEYIEAFKNAWTISKIEFIKYSELEKYISPENSFLTISGYETNVQFVRLYNDGSRKNGINWSNTHLYMELWTCNDKYFKSTNKNKEFGNGDKIQMGRVELYTDFETLADPDKLFQSDYDHSGHIRNWGPGILKNHIQSLMSHLNGAKEKTLYSNILNSKELKNLNNEVLYVPDYVLIKFNKMSGDESKKHVEKDIFEEYKSKYELISTDELNKKILSETTPFYYLSYIKSSTDKYISVINSQTGEIVYSAYSPSSYNIKPMDLKELHKKIQSN